MKPKCGSRSRVKRQRTAVLRPVLAPQLNWMSCRFTVQVSYIDPCSPAEMLHTDSRLAAERQWEKWARQQDGRGGEWTVELFEHPPIRRTTRVTYRKERGGFIYCAEYPRSKCLRRHDYMQPRLPKPNE